MGYRPCCTAAVRGCYGSVDLANYLPRSLDFSSSYHCYYRPRGPRILPLRTVHSQRYLLVVYLRQLVSELPPLQLLRRVFDCQTRTADVKVTAIASYCSA